MYNHHIGKRNTRSTKMTLITYAHTNDPTGARFRQDCADRLPGWAVDVRLDIESYPLVEQRIMDIQADAWAQERRLPTTDTAIAAIYNEFERLGPFHYAKVHSLLVNNSGEEFAVQFMSIYNYGHPGTY